MYMSSVSAIYIYIPYYVYILEKGRPALQSVSGWFAAKMLTAATVVCSTLPSVVGIFGFPQSAQRHTILLYIPVVEM